MTSERELEALANAATALDAAAELITLIVPTNDAIRRCRGHAKNLRELARRLQPARVPHTDASVDAMQSKMADLGFVVPVRFISEGMLAAIAAAPAAEADHSCRNCLGVDPASCMFNPAPESREAPKCADCGAPNGEHCRRRIGNDGEGGVFYMCSRFYDTPEAGQSDGLEAMAEEWLVSTARKAGPHGVTDRDESLMRLGFIAGAQQAGKDGA